MYNFSSKICHFYSFVSSFSIVNSFGLAKVPECFGVAMNCFARSELKLGNGNLWIHAYSFVERQMTIANFTVHC